MKDQMFPSLPLVRPPRRLVQSSFIVSLPELYPNARL